MKIEICPLEKVVLDGTPVFLGMDRAAVERVLGEGELAGARYYYFNSEMAIDYRENKVDFIEFLGGIDGTLKPVIYEISAFESHADDLFALLKKQNNGEIEDQEHGYSYQFPNISVGIYREAIPDEIEEMIAEAAGSGEPMSDAAIEFERRRADHWASIGVGAAGYYQR